MDDKGRNGQVRGRFGHIMNAKNNSQYAHADVPPMLIRTLLRVAQAKGLPASRLCLGLGFSPDDLCNRESHVSYRQTRELTLRLRATLNDPALGLTAGQAQSPLSWGLPGLAMFTCRTLGQALAFCTDHQYEAGALVSHQLDLQDGLLLVRATPRFHDPEMESFLIEESFSAIVTVIRTLVGTAFAPAMVEFAHPQPPHAPAYWRVFDCPVRFGMPTHRMWTSQHWLSHELPGWDPYGSDAVRQSLSTLLKPAIGRDDLLESALIWLRGRLDANPSMSDLAHHLNLGERTLRRRLDALGVSWRELYDCVRRDRALALLQRTALPVDEVASATGFDDIRAFRRAFKRWTGERPSALRQP